ncbi:MAG: hypothetical protein AB7U63_17840, partial [Porticoccaceae bacterium]
MPRLNVANNAGTVLVQACTFSDTTIYVQDVSKFPSPPFRITVDNEIMEVTAVDTNLKTFTVSRAQEGTTATSHNIGASAENRWTAGTYGELAGMADLTWTNVQGKPSSFTPSVHKNTHATGGSDALAPADIGAAAASDLAAHLADVAPHGATSSSTAGRIVLRDTAGRAQMAIPTSAADVARLDSGILSTLYAVRQAFPNAVST